MAQPAVHPFYRFWFKWIDPLVLIPTVYANVFMPEVMLDAFVPASISSYNPDQGFLFHHLAALFTFVGIVQGGVLRVTDDFKVWTVINAGILVVDIAMLVSLYASLEQQGRLSLGLMRSGDWGNLAFTALVATIRIAFLARIGISNGTRAVKRE